MGCDEGLWGSWFCMFVWGVLLAGVHVSGGVVIGEAWCEFFVLLVAGLSLELSVDFVFPEGFCLRLSPCSFRECGLGLGVCVCGCMFFNADVLGSLLYTGCVVVVGAFW